MNRARIALFPHLDLLTRETGRWSLTYSGTFTARRQSGGALTAATRSGNPFPKPFIGQIGELKFATSDVPRPRHELCPNCARHEQTEPNFSQRWTDVPEAAIGASD
jgi:hypothetical protein